MPPPSVAPWQGRLEVVANLLLLSVAATVAARLAGAFDQARLARSFGGSIDLVGVVRLAGEQAGLIAAGGVLVAFLLVTLGPDDRLSSRGVLALRATTVIGLVVAGLSTFAAIATMASSDDASAFGPAASSARTVLDRASIAVPALVAAAIAGYVAWCAFSALGERQPLLFPTDDDT